MKRTILFLAVLLCCTLGLTKNLQRPESYNFQHACELIMDEQFEEGIDLLEVELRQNPQNGYAYAWLASASAHKGEFGTAIQCLERAFRYIPKKDKFYHAWAHDLRAGIALEMKDTALAVRQYTKSVKSDSRNEDWYEHRGLLYRQMRQWKKSDADFKKYIALTPGLVRGQMLLGRNYFLQKRYADALATYAYSYQLAQRSYILSEMANCEVKLEMYEQAADHVVEAFKLEAYEDTGLEVISVCRNVEFAALLQSRFRVQIAKNPDSPEWLFYMVVVERGQRNYENAIRILMKILEIHPNPEINDLLADCYRDLGDWEQALRCENVAIDADSSNIGYRYSRCCIYEEMDSVDAMYADINRLIEEVPDNASLYFARGRMNLFHSHYAQAVEDFETGMAIDSSNDWERYMRGRCYEAVGNQEKARKDFLRVENSGQSIEIRMFAKASLGKREEALRLADSLLRVDSTDNRYFYNAACVYALLGEKELAMKYVEEAMRAGYVRFNRLRHDPDFQSLRGEKWEQLIRKYEALKTSINLKKTR